MNPKDEKILTDQQEPELSPDIQDLADLADKMGEVESEEPVYDGEPESEDVGEGTETVYDSDGYDKDGFDEIGVDREGFDREGFGTDERDREGYDREGFDINGRDREGYSRMGFDREGYDREGYDRFGRDRDGFDRWSRYNIYGYDREGYNRSGFSREGINRYTGTPFNKSGYDKEGYDKDGFNRNGFNREGINRNTNTEYDENGYDKDGYDSYGFNAEGLHRKGYLGPQKQYFAPDPRKDENGVDNWGFMEGDPINIRTGTERDSRGYDFQGFNAEGFDRKGFDREGFNAEGFDRRGFGRDGFNAEGYDRKGFGRDGYNPEGFDRKGFGRDGFNKQGIDQEGYNREGLDKDGYTREYNAKFNKYGVDRNGRLKNGDLDEDVEFALDFAESGFRSQGEYAREKGVEPEYIKKRIEMARKKCPNIDEVITEILQTGNKMRVAIVNNDCSKVLSGEISQNDFWDKHPKLSIVDVEGSFLSDINKKRAFAEKIISSIVMDSDNIDENLRIFTTSAYDVKSALKGLDEFRKIYNRIPVNGTMEDVQAKRQNAKRLYEIEKYLNRYRNKNVSSLLGSRYSRDNGQTWIEFTGETIGEAMDQLKKGGKLICVQTVKDYIIGQQQN